MLLKYPACDNIRLQNVVIDPINLFTWKEDVGQGGIPILEAADNLTIDQGWGLLTKFFRSVIFDFFRIVKTHDDYRISRLYLIGVAAAQPRWHLSNRKYDSNNLSGTLAISKINERSISNPRPRTNHGSCSVSVVPSRCQHNKETTISRHLHPPQSLMYLPVSQIEEINWMFPVTHHQTTYSILHNKMLL